MISATALVMSILACSTFSAYAAEGKSSLSISYTHTQDADPTYRMYINIQGGGSVFDGSQELFLSGSIYLLKEGQEKTFRIAPYNGYQLVSVIYDHTIITNGVDGNGYVTVTSKAHDTELLFTFEKKSDNVKTGDQTQYLILAIVLILAFMLIGTIFMLHIINKKEKQNYHR